MPDMPAGLAPSLAGDVPGMALSGLLAPRKTLPPSLFYDEAGSRLFERITRLPEYYPTRTEMALLPEVARDVARQMPAGAAVVEYGAGSEAKAVILLAALREPYAWIPVDVAGPSLDRAAARMRLRFPDIFVLPSAADFLQPLALPAVVAGHAMLGFFPGSTIGNLDRAEAVAFLRRAARTLGSGTHFLIGVDVPKDPAVLVAAYNDARGVTAAFNLNLLHRLNREAGADFDPDAFAHRALWNAPESRIEMHLISRRRQDVCVAGAVIHFEEGESIHTENSHKYAPDAFRALALAGGWTPVRLWIDPAHLFSVHLLSAG